MIKVVPVNSSGLDGFDGLHCTAYPSPSALEACAICNDKWRMEQFLKRNIGEYESTEDAVRGTAIHKACAILLTTLINNAASTGRKVYQMALFASISDDLNKIAGWSNEYWSLAYKSVQSVMCELYRMEEKHKNVNVYIETVVDLSKYLEGYYGTADVIAIGGSELLVADYKFGYRKVSAHENKQLVCYASGYLNDDIKHVTLLIVQSSINHYSRYETSDYAIKALMDKNVRLIRTVCNKGIHGRCVSDASCAYCTARTVCSAYKNSNFGDLIDAINSDRELTSDEKAKLYMLVNMAVTWQKSIRSDVIKDINEGKCNDFYLKQNKDKESVKKEKAQEALDAVKADMDDLLLEGAIDCEWKFDVKKLREHYGADFERKLGQFVVRTAGNIVIKMREREQDVSKSG